MFSMLITGKNNSTLFFYVHAQLLLRKQLYQIFESYFSGNREVGGDCKSGNCAESFQL